MKYIKVDLGSKSYGIYIGKDILSYIGRLVADIKIAQAAYIITNKNIRLLYGDRLSESFTSSGLEIRFCIVADSEKSKSFATYLKVVKDIARFDKGRGIVVVALGGGVIGDLSGFVASTYRRGVPFIQVPTTLLAQVDSAIGGKVAIDIEYAKNLVGAFYQPMAVFSDISTLKSLPVREIRNGLAEVIKYGVILDRALFSYLEKNMSRILRADQMCMEYIVSRCSSIKSKVVSCDERESGYRSILNFGHTIGHAIETATSYSKFISHGEAISVGMLVAFDIACSLKLSSKDAAEQVESLIKKGGLPTAIKGINLAKVLEATSYDKKIQRGKRRWVLPLGIGHAAVCADIPTDIIEKAIIKLMASR